MGRLFATVNDGRWPNSPYRPFLYTESRSVVCYTETGRFGRPDEVADTALFLASGRAGFITGENVVDGGLTGGMDTSFVNDADERPTRG